MQGSCLWDLCLDKYTGDGRFDGEAFLGRLLIFFLGGVGEGKRSSRSRVAEGFSQDETAPNSPVCVIYYMLSSGSFAAASLQTIAKGGSSILGRPGQTRAMFQVLTARRPGSHIEDGEGAVAPRSVTDSTEQWV